MYAPQKRHWFKQLLIWAPLTTVIAAWLVSLFNVQWAPQTRRHLFQFGAGCSVVQWQRPSMPCILPTTASRSDVLSFYSLPPCSRMMYYGTNSTQTNPQCSAVMFKPGIKVLGFHSLEVFQWSVKVRYEASTHTHLVIVPLYIPFLIAVILPAVSIVKSLRKRKSGNQCPYCDYDLTGNQSGICPECGQQIIAPCVQADCSI